MTDEDPFDTDEWREYARDAEENLVPKIRGSVITMQLFTGEIDAKLAIELGYSILLDKPILVLALEGAPIPEHLRRIADGIVEIDGDMRDPVFAQRIQTEIDRILKEKGLTDGD